MWEPQILQPSILYMLGELEDVFSVLKGECDNVIVIEM